MTDATGEAPARPAPHASPRSSTLRLNRRHNADVAWDTFEPQAYWELNYRTLRKDDDAIIQRVGSFFADHFGAADPGGRRGVDVGSGSNLYPAMGMLPWCQEIILTDQSRANVRWLRKSLFGSGHVPRALAPARLRVARWLSRSREPWAWQQFWEAYADGKRKGYAPDAPVRQLLARRAIVERRSIFQLQPNSYDVGTMFFVAESMTSYRDEFKNATGSFLRSLRPGSPFAAAFMDSSQGYTVAGQPYPAVREVTYDEVRRVLAKLGAVADVEKIDAFVDKPLRKGYDGMIIAVGTTGPKISTA